jgi:hypothetical protein
MGSVPAADNRQPVCFLGMSLLATAPLAQPVQRKTSNRN